MAPTDEFWKFVLPLLLGTGFGIANRFWDTDAVYRTAQKVRQTIIKELELIQQGGPSANETLRFEKVEKLMEA